MAVFVFINEKNVSLKKMFPEKVKMSVPSHIIKDFRGSNESLIPKSWKLQSFKKIHHKKIVWNIAFNNIFVVAWMSVLKRFLTIP